METCNIHGFINLCFKKVKIETTEDYKLEQLYDKRRYLGTKDDEESKEALEDVEEELADIYAERMYHKIKDEIKVMNNEEGGYNPGHLWKLKQKLSPRHSETLTTMKDANGKLLTSEEEIKCETLKYYKKGLRVIPWIMISSNMRVTERSSAKSV